MKIQLDKEKCPKYIPQMTEEDHHLYSSEMTQRHWMCDIKWTDFELEQALIRDLGEERVKNYFASLYYSPWTWVCNDVFKYYYQKGKFMLLDDDYLDGQNEAIIWDIMKARGDGKTIDEIVVRKQ